VAQGVARGPTAPLPQHLPPAAAQLGMPSQQRSGTAPPHYLWKRMDFTRVTTSRLALCPAHTIATCRSCPETNVTFLRAGHPHPQSPASSSWGPCYGERLHNAARRLGKEARSRWESPGSEAGTRSLPATPPVWLPSPEKQDTLDPQLRDRWVPITATAGGEQCQAAAHPLMPSQGASSLPPSTPCSPRRYHHPPHTCAPSAAWDRPCGCCSRGGPHPRRRPPTAGCHGCPRPGQAAGGAAGSPPPPCAPERPAPPAPRPGPAARPRRAAAGGSGHLQRRQARGMGPGADGGQSPGRAVPAHSACTQPTSQLCSPGPQGRSWKRRAQTHLQPLAWPQRNHPKASATPAHPPL